MTFQFTEKQGQYLAYIYHYTKVNRQPPAESVLYSTLDFSGIQFSKKRKQNFTFFAFIV